MAHGAEYRHIPRVSSMYDHLLASLHPSDDLTNPGGASLPSFWGSPIGHVMWWGVCCRTGAPTSVWWQRDERNGVGSRWRVWWPRWRQMASLWLDATLPPRSWIASCATIDMLLPLKVSPLFPCIGLQCLSPGCSCAVTSPPSMADLFIANQRQGLCIPNCEVT
jgi:hypothetical protein